LIDFSQNCSILLGFFRKNSIYPLSDAAFFKLSGANLEWLISLISISVSRHIENEKPADAQALVCFLNRQI
tara:strand:+ start:2092 stop:2304 length:213 start_codon:yes stop_codon:yes gene_type:complete